MAEGLAARMAAIELLDEVLGQGRMLSQIEESSEISGAERARAMRLAMAVLRHLEPVDTLLSRHLRKSPPLLVMNVLRLAVVERMLGAPAHGVVNAAVEMVRRGRRTGHMTGLVNAVLRALPAEDVLNGLPAQRLPRWIRQPLVHAYGRDVVSAIEAAQAAGAPVDLTVKPGAMHPEGLLLPGGSVRLMDGGQVSALPGYAEGDWWVQDAAAAMAVRLLNPRKGERVLDLCAAPGGKTMQLAAAGAAVVAVDISGPRMGRVAENLARTGLTAELIVADAMQWQPEGLFDAVLLDAPCSATGTIRRHPDLPFVKDGSEVAGVVALQAALLDRALAWLKPGGRLVFCTCSLLPEEGERQLEAGLARHAGLRALAPDMAGLEPGWVTPEGGLRLRPDYWADKGGMDGFFMVHLQSG